MTIHIESWGQLFGVVLAGIAIIGIVATIHWTMFAEPRLRKMIHPISFGLTVTSRVVKDQFPEPFRQAEANARRESELWGSV